MTRTRLDGATDAERLAAYSDRSGGPDACWLWTRGKDTSGYGTMTSKLDVRAHRVAFILANGPIPAGCEILHSCDVRACVNPAHLSAGSHRENMRDLVDRGRTALGERHPRHKLTDQDVALAFQLKADGWLNREIGERLGVSQPFISRLLRGQRGAGRTDNELWSGRKELSDDDIRTIRAERAAGVLGRILAERFGVHVETVYAISNGALHTNR